MKKKKSFKDVIVGYTFATFNNKTNNNKNVKLSYWSITAHVYMCARIAHIKGKYYLCIVKKNVSTFITVIF